jgi:hypothetical protein
MKIYGKRRRQENALTRLKKNRIEQEPLSYPAAYPNSLSRIEREISVLETRLGSSK